jgi:15-cis-phytoene synthase
MRNRLTVPWDEKTWIDLEGDTARRALACRSEHGAWLEIHRFARRILSTYSTSFFIVTRFLPPAKRAQVEVLYAAVRYPDEIVDTFPLTPAEQLSRLDAWQDAFEASLTHSSLHRALESGIPPVLAGWGSVVQRVGIPPGYYRDFLDAMRHDAAPRHFGSLDDLVDGYIYGSAIVVGYFLAHVYGPGSGRDLSATLAASRDLGIALQLTNFLRDVREDARRGRLYLPQDLLRREGITTLDVDNPDLYPALTRVLRELSCHADALYERTQNRLDVFAEDCRVAIHACIEVYRQLNARIGRSPDGILHRESVPFIDKYRVLPRSKYWRLPLAYFAG